MTVIMIGGILFMATTVAGLLMFYQIQSSTSFEESTKALYAADAGLDAAVYYYFYEFDFGQECYPNACNIPPSEMPTFANGAEITRAEILTPPPSSGEPIAITVRGESGRTARLLQITFSSSL